MVGPQFKQTFLGTSSTVWLTKAVDIEVSYPVHVVVYTVPSLRRPPVLLVRQRIICRGNYRLRPESQELIITLCVLLNPEETTCTTRTLWGYVRGGTDYALS